MLKSKFTLLLYLLAIPVFFTSCDDDSEDIMTPSPTGNETEYNLSSLTDENISGTAIFVENENSTTVVLDLSNTSGTELHPAHIHANTAAEGGNIVISLEPVDPATGTSSTEITATDAGDAITYEQLIDLDGYINVHQSENDLGTILAQGDIGQNDLTGTTKVYNLSERAVEGISGTITFAERINEEALATIDLEGTPEDGEHPAHIHFNSYVQGGGIAFTFNPVNGTTGMSQTNVAELDDGSAITYQQLLSYDGYVNVHLSADDLATIVAQGDIGQNELTGTEKVYDLNERAVPGISGTATFQERLSGEALAILDLEGTPDDGEHPAHIHVNSAAEGGSIAYTFTPVDGSTGMSLSHVDTLDNGEPFVYEDVLAYDGYINVHLSAEDLATIVAQGDIGVNELTGNEKVYTLDTKDVEGISGTATFQERLSGEALATIDLEGTPEGGEHPAHIHMNSAAEGGNIAFTFTPVNGTTGMSVSNVAALDDETAFGYEDVLGYDGYINVHLSAEDLATIVAQGDIGSNAPE